MKIYISTDAEGVAGITDWEQIRHNGDDFALGRRLLLGELNAAIDGVIAIDPEAQIVVNDSHGAMRNYPPDELHGNAELIAGRHKPMYMMQGLDESFDAIFFLGYHGSIGAPQAILSHTYNPRAVWEVRIDNQIVGESAINGLVAAHYQVPVVFISGDEVTATEAFPYMPNIVATVVKYSQSRFAAHNIHPQIARTMIQNGVQRALQGDMKSLLPVYSQAPTLAVTFLTADMAQLCSIIRGVTVQPDQPRTALYTGTDYLAMYQSFVGMLLITRALVE